MMNKMPVYYMSVEFWENNMQLEEEEKLCLFIKSVEGEVVPQRNKTRLCESSDVD
jgi:hypothetical protein